MPRRLIYNTIRLLGAQEANALEKATHNPLEVQEKKLASILAKNGKSQFGLEHNFASIKTVEDFQKAVPIRTYDELSPYIQKLCNGERNILTEEDPFMFATTSGTTSSPKFIPMTKSYIKEFRYASIASGYHLMGNFPQVVDGNVLLVVSPAEEGRTPANIPYGAISGLLYKSEPWVIKKYVAPIPYDVFLIKDYESRYYTLLRAALCLPLSVIYTMNPSTILLLSRRLERYGAQLVKDIYDGTLTPPSAVDQSVKEAMSGFCQPNRQRAIELDSLLKQGGLTPGNAWMSLQTICCWTKAAASFYLADFPEFFGDVPVCDFSYGASEGRGTVTLDPERQVLALRSHFFEFIAEEDINSQSPKVLTCDQLESGRNYYILFTTSAGLYRYNINDVVKVIGFHNQTPLLEFQYKGGNVCSFTGEKITEIQVTEAMKLALSDVSQKVAFFTLIPQFRPNPHYELWIEPIAGQALAQVMGVAGIASSPEFESLVRRLAECFDERLSDLNIEYHGKRESTRLDPISIRFISLGAYEHLRKTMAQQGVPDAQIKFSHLNPKDEIRKYFEAKLVLSAALKL